MNETAEISEPKTHLANNVEIVGALPDRGSRPRLLICFSNTPTERALLDQYLAECIHRQSSEASTSIAWITEAKDRDDLLHTDLLTALEQSETLDLIPIGVAWKPKTSLQQSWRSIMSWTHLTDNNFRQQRMIEKRPDRCAVIIGEFGTWKALKAKHQRQAISSSNAAVDDPQLFADYVALQAALTIERDARSVTGETIKYPRHVQRSIWSRPAFQATLNQIAQEHSRSLEDVKTEARNCLKELVPKVRAPHVSLSGAFLRTVCRLGYEEKLVYNQEKINELRELTLTKPTALVWTHKTHIDGGAMLVASRDESFPLVHIIGGENMAFFGVGYLMRRSGAVFIRRSIDSPVYKAVLRNYLSFLLQKRFPVSWALEGTRSRNGKLMPPRFGILKYVVEAAAKENMRDLTLVPISIYYDLIAELGDYAAEQTGATKRKESLAWFTGYLRSLRKPLGRISLGFGKPVVIDTATPEITKSLETGGDSFSVELQKLAFQASVNVNEVTAITPSALIALALTGAAPKALTEEELGAQMIALRDWIKERGYPLTEDLINSDRKRMRAVASAMIDMGVVSRYDAGPEAVYSIADGKHFEASYYRNTAIHFFVNKALIELALAKAAEGELSGEDGFWREIEDLRDIYKFEFFYPEFELHKKDIIAELDRYDPGWRKLLLEGGALLGRMEPLVSHSVLRPFTEAYSIVADILIDHKFDDENAEKSIVDAALKLGKQAFLQRRITSEESIGKLMFSNGYQLAANRGLAPGDTNDLKAARLIFARKLKNIARRLQRLRELSERADRDYLKEKDVANLKVAGKDA